MTQLSPAEEERYAAQLALSGFGVADQARLRDASVLVAGAGGLGGAVAMQLVASGVGRVGIVDDEEVALSQLARQVGHFTPDVHEPKAESLAAKLRFLNPEVIVEAYRARIEAANADAMVLGQDVVVDATNAPAARVHLNDAACAAALPLVSAEVQALRGRLLVVQPGITACRRCLDPAPPTTDPPYEVPEGGRLGAVSAVVGAAAALEALKLLAPALGTSTAGRLLLFDGAAHAWTAHPVTRRAGCEACGE